MMEESVRDIWHVFSDGVRADIPFLTKEDRVFAWNSVPICAERSGVKIWVETVNDTHLHSLVKGEEENVQKFRDLLVLRLSTYLRKLGRDDKIYMAMDPVKTRTEALTKFMYVYRNCMDFYRKLPGEYAWGSGNIYFSEKRHFCRGRRVGDLSGRERDRLFATRAVLPADWYFDENGKILPESFLDYEAVERLFVSPRTFIAFLFVRKDDEAALKQDVYYRYLAQRTMEDNRRRANYISLHSYGVKLRMAPLETRLKIAGKMIKEGTGNRSASFAKALYLEPQDLIKLV